ncbi:uncharacterized protein LOC110661416 [Hevea brasiliensis]|uniref:uncharacterized protein LOC110661416 n=1 Tax=Hevea brasiliensis TaxID=3981 RepID=UPI000B78EFE3|nr:uncharacterized protein LOC110661416 [Hevea brasiliensis]
MVRNKDEIGKAKQFKWSKPMSQMLLKVLAEKAIKGNKPSLTFKPKSFTPVVVEINKKKKIGVECLSEHVENRLKTVKKEWITISTLRAKSGFVWDDNLKIANTDKHVYKRK